MQTSPGNFARRRGATITLALVAALMLSGCEAEPRSDQPLSAYLVASRLTGHTARVTEVAGTEYYLAFAYNGVVRTASDGPQYDAWSTDAKGELCLQKTGGGGKDCAPLYQLTVERFRWGASIFVLTR